MSGGVSSYLIEDGNGSTVATTNSAGQVTAQYAYSAYGTPSPSNGPETSYTFDGAQYDPRSGLYYMGSRYYDPVTGQFISQDPVTTGTATPRLSNFTTPTTSRNLIPVPSAGRYDFAADEPSQLRDPSGEAPSLPQLASQACIGFLLFAASGYSNGTPTAPLVSNAEDCIQEVVKGLGERSELLEELGATTTADAYAVPAVVEDVAGRALITYVIQPLPTAVQISTEYDTATAVSTG